MTAVPIHLVAEAMARRSRRARRVSVAAVFWFGYLCGVLPGGALLVGYLLHR